MSEEDKLYPGSRGMAWSPLFHVTSDIISRHETQSMPCYSLWTASEQWILVIPTLRKEVTELVHTAGGPGNPGGRPDLDPSAVSCRWGPWSCRCCWSSLTSSCASRLSPKLLPRNTAAAHPAARLLWCRARPACHSLAAAGGRRKSTRDVCPPKGERWGGDAWVIQGKGDYAIGLEQRKRAARLGWTRYSTFSDLSL